MLYRKKPDVFEVYQFNEFGEIGPHIKIEPYCIADGGTCAECGGMYKLHGELNGHRICPGDYVLIDRNGNRHAVNPSVLAEGYEVI